MHSLRLSITNRLSISKRFLTTVLCNKLASQTTAALLATGVILLVKCPALPAQTTGAGNKSGLVGAPRAIAVTHCLILGPVTGGGRYTLHRDPLEAQLVAGNWHPPVAGESIVLADGNAGAAVKPAANWREIAADKNGWLADDALGGGYAYANIDADRDEIMLLTAQGHSLVYVNGVPRAGDPYEYGYVHTPVALKKGRNSLLFVVGRGRLRATLEAPTTPISLDAVDATLPDLVHGQSLDTIGAVVATNATTEIVRGLALEMSGDGFRTTRTQIPPLLPLSTRKIAFRIRADAPKKAGDQKIGLHLIVPAAVRATTRLVTFVMPLSLRVRELNQTRKCTFVSEIDGSVQYYALNPAQTPAGDETPPALILTLHGASVEGLGQADAYAPKTWAHLVAPTNRRPYGFDWEDWGRIDALEVLETARKSLHTDSQHTYLTGHSMGGHGTWQLGALFPDKFAAIAPSAGWISFFSYAGGKKIADPTPVESILNRASAASDTLLMGSNYAQEGVYILHGGADDNVPVTEARTMFKYLSAFHKDVAYHEEPGAGHWWGSLCVDWPQIFEMFKRRVLPLDADVRHVDFTTVDPGVSARCHWLTIAQQIHALQVSHADIRLELKSRAFSGTTLNIARLGIDLIALPKGGSFHIELDGQVLENVRNTGGKVWLERQGDRWKVSTAPAPTQKTPERSGPFKMAFTHKMLFVYGTKGTAEENAQCFATARFDAETFWYRGNGAIDVLADTEFRAGSERDRSVILYGNSDTNGAWSDLLAGSPVQVKRGFVTVGSRTFTGEDLAALFLRPRPGSKTACVGVVSGSGLAGMRLAERMPIFLSGAGLPDCLVVGADTLVSGAGGVRTAGFFGNDWRVETGDFAWSK